MPRSRSTLVLTLVAALMSATFTTPASAQSYVYALGKVFGTPSWRSYVTVIDAATNTKIQRIQLGGTGGSILPQGMAMAPDGARLYVSNDYDFTISVIATQTNTVIDTWPTALVGPNPFALAVSPDNRILYVVGFQGSLIGIDIASKTRVVDLPVGQGPLRGVAVTPDGSRIYVTAYPVNGLTASVTVIQTNPLAVVTTVPLPANSRPYALSVSSDGRKLYIPLPYSTSLQQNSSIAVLDTATNTVVATPTVGPRHFHVLTSPDGATVYTGGSAALARLDPVTHAVAGTTPGISDTYGVTFTPDSATAYLATQAGVVAVSRATHTVTRRIPFDSSTDGYVSAVVATPPAWTQGSAAPTGLNASVVGNRVTLSWTAPTAGGTPTGYVLEGGVSPGQVLASVATGSATPGFAFDAPDGTFYVRVHAQTTTGRSQASNEIQIFVNVPRTPSAPAGLLGLVNGTTLALAWKNTSGGGAPTSILLDVSGALSGTVPLGPTDTFSYPAMPPGTYTFAVRAANAAGTSAPSTPVTLTFPGGCSGAPNTPTQLAAGRSGSTLSIGWDLPAAGPAPTSYVLQVRGAIDLDAPLTQRLVSGGVPPGTYNLSVVAVNACGTSAPTPVQSVTVP